jgi:hypothetical protein
MSASTAPSRSRLSRLADAVSVSDRLALVPGGRATASRTPFVALIVVMLVGGVLGLLAFNTQMQQRSFAASRLQREATALTAQQQGLRMDLQTLRDPQHLAVSAKKLGMVAPANPAFVMLGTGKVLGDPLATTMADQVAINQPAAPKPSALNPPAKIVHVPAKTTTKKSTTKTTDTKKSTNKTATNKSHTHGAASTGKTAKSDKKNTSTTKHHGTAD